MTYVPYKQRHGEYVPNWTPSFTLEQRIAEARKAMGEERWAQLNKEWNDD